MISKEFKRYDTIRYDVYVDFVFGYEIVICVWNELEKSEFRSWILDNLITCTTFFHQS